MSRPRWNQGAAFRQLVLEPEFEDRLCAHCGKFTHIYEHRDRRLWLMSGATHLVSKIAHCVDKTCPGHVEVIESPAEMGIAPPVWMIGWDVFAWMGHRRFCRHWSVPQIRAELKDAHDIAVSPDLIEDYLRRYQAIVAARESAPEQLADVYRDVEDLVLTIDGLQPEKGHETLYVVRELRCKRIWFAVPLLSSATSEVKRLFEKAAEWAMTLNKPVRAWISDKQQAFLTGVAEVFPGVPHRYCANHFFRDVAKPVLDLDSEIKVQMRRKVRGLRAVERGILEERARTAEAALLPIVSSLDPANGETEASGVQASQQPPCATRPTAASTPADVPCSAPQTEAQDIVLEYSAAIRGILNDDQGGPLHPPGVRMAEALGEVRASLRRAVQRKKGDLVTAS